MKSHAYLLGRCDLIIHPAVVREGVGMIENSRTAGGGKFGKAHEAGPACRLSCPAGPDRIESLEPGKQGGVLGTGLRPSQRLVEVVVGVHETGQYDLTPSHLAKG